LQGSVSASQQLLRRQALLSYTGGTGPTFGASSAVGDPSVRAEYLQVATGNINDSIDQYRAQQRLLASAAANLTSQAQASQRAMATEANARQQALAQATAEQTKLDQLEGQLHQYIEAVAIAAAQQPTAVAAPNPTQGLPVNNGLVSVVHTIVAPPPPPAPSPPPPPPTPGYTDAGGPWLQLRECESSDNYAENTGNGYYGAYQFSQQTWTDLGFPGRPDLGSHQMQDQAAMKLQAQSGWGQWPACSAALGLH
jgi:multidrug efflux pump subunit AcrA (membrane-fusion protein)